MSKSLEFMQKSVIGWQDDLDRAKKSLENKKAGCNSFEERLIVDASQGALVKHIEGKIFAMKLAIEIHGIN